MRCSWVSGGAQQLDRVHAKTRHHRFADVARLEGVQACSNSGTWRPGLDQPRSPLLWSCYPECSRQRRQSRPAVSQHATAVFGQALRRRPRQSRAIAQQDMARMVCTTVVGIPAVTRSTTLSTRKPGRAHRPDDGAHRQAQVEFTNSSRITVRRAQAQQTVARWPSGASENSRATAAKSSPARTVGGALCQRCARPPAGWRFPGPPPARGRG